MENKSVIIKFEQVGQQTVENITRFVGFIKAKYVVYIIDALDLDANPRSSKTGAVTDAIQESIEHDPATLPFKTKGILLASSQYECLERNRIKLTPGDPNVEGILDGGHNTLAIGLYILQQVADYNGISLKKGSKTWDDFKALWAEHHDMLDNYLEDMRHNPSIGHMDFLVPIELLVPRDPTDYACVECFKSNLLDICAARNNNVQLQAAAKSNQRGYFDSLRHLMDEENPSVSNRIEWKPNDGGDIKVNDIVALAWIPLQLITPVKDQFGRTIDPIAPRNLYSSKGGCLKQFERLMSSPDVTNETSIDYKRELHNSEVLSAFRITSQLPALYDYIYEEFPKLYNAAGGSYGRITAVKTLHRSKTTPYSNKPIETPSPEGFIMPLVYGLLALMEKVSVNGTSKILWRQDPMEFLKNNLDKIVKNYSGLFSMCDYDPQKIGKNPQSYNQSLSAFKMAMAGILDM